MVFPEQFPAHPSLKSSAKPFLAHSSTPGASHSPQLFSEPPHRCARCSALSKRSPIFWQTSDLQRKWVWLQLRFVPGKWASDPAGSLGALPALQRGRALPCMLTARDRLESTSGGAGQPGRARGESSAQSPKGDAAQGTYLSQRCCRNSENKLIKHSPALGWKLDQPCVNYREGVTK